MSLTAMRGHVSRSGCRLPMHLPNCVGNDITVESDVTAVSDPPTAKHSELVTEMWLDTAFMNQLHRIAGRWLNQKSSALPTQDVVSDVLGDLLSGDFAPVTGCNADARAAVRREVRRRAKAVRNGYRTIYLDEAPPEAWIDRATDPDPEDEHFDETLLPAIVELAKDDLPVRQLLDFYEERVLLSGTIPHRRDVLQLGMKKWIYDRARARLLEYAERALTARSEASAGEPGDSDA